MQKVSGDVGKEPFDLVDPGRVRRRVMHVESGMGVEPFNDRGALVGAVVIADQVNV